MPDDPNTDEGPVLDESWGAYAGYPAEEALRISTTYQAEMATENQRLRAKLDELRSGQPPSPPPPKTEEKPSEAVKPDLETIRGEDPAKAAEALADYTQQVVEDTVSKRERAQAEANFTTDRMRAKQDAAGILRSYGVNAEEFAKYEKLIDQNMQEGKGVPKKQQTQPLAWVQAFVNAKGIEAISPKNGEQTETTDTGGDAPTAPTLPFAAPPSPRRVPQHEKSVQFDSEDETRSYENFNRVLSGQGGVSRQEWKKLDDPNFQLQDYERMVQEQNAKKKSGRRS